MNLLLLIAALLLAVALFIAGAVWRGRVSRGELTKDPARGISSVLLCWPNPARS